jgi:hypothetical protein
MNNKEVIHPPEVSPERTGVSIDWVIVEVFKPDGSEARPTPMEDGIGDLCRCSALGAASDFTRQMHLVGGVEI